MRSAFGGVKPAASASIHLQAVAIAAPTSRAMGGGCHLPPGPTGPTLHRIGGPGWRMAMALGGDRHTIFRVGEPHGPAIEAAAEARGARANRPEAGDVERLARIAHDGEVDVRLDRLGLRSCP